MSGDDLKAAIAFIKELKPLGKLDHALVRGALDRARALNHTERMDEILDYMTHYTEELWWPGVVGLDNVANWSRTDAPYMLRLLQVKDHDDRSTRKRTIRYVADAKRNDSNRDLLVILMDAVPVQEIYDAMGGDMKDCPNKDDIEKLHKNMAAVHPVASAHLNTVANECKDLMKVADTSPEKERFMAIVECFKNNASWITLRVLAGRRHDKKMSLEKLGMLAQKTMDKAHKAGPQLLAWLFVHYPGLLKSGHCWKSDTIPFKHYCAIVYAAEWARMAAQCTYGKASLLLHHFGMSGLTNNPHVMIAANEYYQELFYKDVVKFREGWELLRALPTKETLGFKHADLGSLKFKRALHGFDQTWIMSRGLGGFPVRMNIDDYNYHEAWDPWMLRHDLERAILKREDSNSPDGQAVYENITSIVETQFKREWKKRQEEEQADDALNVVLESSDEDEYEETEEIKEDPILAPEEPRKRKELPKLPPAPKTRKKKKSHPFAPSSYRRRRRRK